MSAAPLGQGVVGTPYNQSVTATGGTPAYTFTYTATGTLPPGLTLNPTTGAITGTPTTVGLFSFTVQAAAAAGTCVNSDDYSINIVAAALPPGIPTLNWVGMALLIALIAGAGMFLAGRSSL